MKRRFLTLAIFAVALAVPAWAQDGLRGVLSQAVYGPQLHPTVAGADFDGDHVADAAVLVDDGRTRLPWDTRVIELHLTGRDNARLTFRTQETSLAVAALDVNHDGATDIVVERAFSRERVQVWLNDGRGGFRHVDARRFPADTSLSPVGFDRGPARDDAPLAVLPMQGRLRLAVAADCSNPHHDETLGHLISREELSPCSPAAGDKSSRAPPAHSSRQTS